MKNTRFAICGRIIDAVSDTALEKGLVLVEDGIITYVGEMREIPHGVRVMDAAEGTIMPGFIDCHSHLSGNYDPLTRTHFDNILTASHQLELLLDAGFTTLRDMSLYGPALSRAVERGEINGPAIVPGGRVLSPTAGHSDSYTTLPQEMVEALDPVGILCDGVEGCLRTVRTQFREGARFIKICATGGVSSAADGLEDVQFSDDEIAAICAEAARHGTYVTAHCSNAAGARQALENGVLCIEHGIDLDERCIELMSQNNVPLITTLFVSNLVATHPGYPDHMRKKGQVASKKHTASVLRAKAAGILIALGTDFSNSRNTPYLGNGMEFSAMVNAGFTPMEAIKAGTINAAMVVKKGEVIGSLEPNKQADIVVVRGNPLNDITCLTHADHVALVMQGGQIKKNLLLGSADNEN